MGNIWILIVIGVTAMIIGTLLRGQKQPRGSIFQRRRDEFDMPPRQDFQAAPPTPSRRRMQPPPLPKVRITEVQEVIPIAKPAPSQGREPPPALGPTATVQRNPQTQATAQVVAMLRHPKTLRAAMLLHEVLGPPVCRRRLPVAYAPNMPSR
ncbi:MAG TPA: hypothetical protein VE988_25545 [Gemmataceae bacterium]|nr:hypothetical protein [Gemmataceae bacterium]